MAIIAAKPLTIDDLFVLDRYQGLILLFNEALIFTMLSNVVRHMY